MTEPEWAPIADRLRLVWPDLSGEKARLYLDILQDLPAERVAWAAEGILRESSGALPPPGAFRELAGRAPRQSATRPPTAEPVLAMMGAKPFEISAAAAPQGPPAPFNGLALAALLVAICGLAPLLALAGAGKVEDYPPAIELLVAGGIGLPLGLRALARAKDGRRRNGTLSHVAVVFSGVALLFGLGSLGLIVKNAGESGGSVATASDADAQRAAVQAAVEKWSSNARRFAAGYVDAAESGSPEEWLSIGRLQLLQMRAAVGTLEGEIAIEPNARVRAALRPVVASFKRQTNLATKLRDNVRTGAVQAELRTRNLLDQAVAQHASIAAEAQNDLEGVSD